MYTRDINAALHAVHAIDTGITYVNAPTIGAEIPLPVRRHQAHRQRLPRGGRPRHRAVQPGEDGVRRLLGHAPTGADRQPGGRVMSAAPTTTPTAHRRVARPLRRRGRPGAAGLLRRRRRARRRLVRVGRRRSSLPRPRLGHRRHQHRPPAPPRRGGDPRAGRRAAPHVGGAQAPALHPGLRGDRRAWPRSCATRRCSSATAAPRRSTAPSSWPAAPPGKPGIIGFRRAFHGRTMGATSLTTAKAAYQEGYGPLLPAVHVAPYGVGDAGRRARRARPAARHRGTARRRWPR